MLKIAITGGIASGKSFVLKRISALGYPAISADDEIAKMYQNPDILKDISRLLEISDASKQKVKEIIFQNPSKRRILERFLHKKLHKKFEDFSRKYRLSKAKVCFFEIPLLFEKKTHNRYDRVIIVDSPIFLRKRRFLARGGAEKDFYKFNNLQLHTMQKLHLARSQRTNLILNFYDKNLLNPLDFNSQVLQFK